MSDYSDIVATIAIIFSFLSFIVSLRTLEYKNPMIKICTEDLPPYKDKNQNTSITITNQGSAPGIDPEIIISFSWQDGEISHVFDGEWIEVNESLKYSARLPEPPSNFKGELKIVIEANVRKRNLFRKKDFCFSEEIPILNPVKSK